MGDDNFNALVQDPQKGILNVMRQIIYDVRDEPSSNYGKTFFISDINSWSL